MALIKHSGLPTSWVYWHFENRAELFVALLERIFTRRGNASVRSPSVTRAGARRAVFDMVADATDERAPSAGWVVDLRGI